MTRGAVVLLLLLTALTGVSCSSREPAADSGQVPPPTAGASEGAPAPGTHVVRGTAPRAVNNGVVIVTLTPDPPREFPVADEQPQMDQVNLTFVPAVLLVRTGQPVLFLNDDDVLHNVRVREEATREGAFNVAIPTGGSYTFTFPRDGFYIVGCDIHPGMAAAVFAASTPYATVAGSDGSFSFANVEAGTYTLSAHAGSQTFTQTVHVEGPTTEVAVVSTSSGDSE
jgi:plastocyanin